MVLITGAAETVVVTNLAGGDSLTVPARGVRTRITTDVDGVSRYEITGNVLLVLFSTDLGGAGLTPSSTTLIAGRTVFTVDAAGVYTVQEVRGTTTDVCAELAP